MRRRTNRYPRQLEVYELYEAFRDNPQLQESFAEAGLLEGTGAPEGRADFPFFLQTVIRMRMRERFRAVAAKYKSYTGRETAQDFREHRVTQLNGIVGVEPVNEFGEYPRMRSTEEPGPSFSVGKHGGIYGISFEMVVNDEADRMLNRIPREMGRSTAEYVSRVVVAFVESNPTYIDGSPFFTATPPAGRQANERVGATAQPTEANLVSVLSEMTLRRDANLTPYTVKPEKVITKTIETQLLFRKILQSQQTGATVNDPTARAFPFGTKNAVEGILPYDAIEQEPWFNDGDDWIILADAEDRPAFIVAHLRNNEEPFIGVKDDGVRSALSGSRDPYTFDFDEIPFKARHVFGTGQGDPNAAYRMRPA
ncbi:MAG: hypothetical protein LC798_12750 [Chloroflexi bacterium]|nr:hypothetical protein [Chloroflexota bacterium]